LKQQPKKDQCIVVGRDSDSAFFLGLEKRPAHRGWNLRHLINRRMRLLHEREETADPALRLRNVTFLQGSTTRQILPADTDVIEHDGGHSRSGSDSVNRLHQLLGRARGFQIELEAAWVFARDRSNTASLRRNGLGEVEFTKRATPTHQKASGRCEVKL